MTRWGLAAPNQVEALPVRLLFLRLCACRFKELRDYVLARRDALGGGKSSKEPSMMNLDIDDAEALKKSGKGFA